MRVTIIRCAALVVACVLGTAWSAEAQWRISSADQKTSLTFGVLAQPQFESVTAPDDTDAAKNFFFRRLRFILGGKVTDRVSFFIDTDSPNVGKANAAGRKNEDAIFLQDAILTFTVHGSIHIDGGLMFVPASRQSTQSAANLLGVDYGAFAFTHSDPTNSRVGRDYGVQTRGYVANKHLEFRAGVFNGARGAGATAPMRYAVRAVWYPLEAETGFFYQGTALGAKKVVSVGASMDAQDDYKAGSADLYVDHPIAGGRQAVTAQLNYVRYDGGTTFTQLPEQDVWFVEAGWFHKAAKVGPFVQWTTKRFVAAGLADETRLTGGLSYWAEGHRFNIKAGVAQQTKTNAKDRIQFVVQGQVFMF
jgi:Phosphate-selective porin O and P